MKDVTDLSLIKQLTDEALAMDEPYFQALQKLADVHVAEAEARRALTYADCHRLRACDILEATRRAMRDQAYTDTADERSE